MAAQRQRIALRFDKGGIVPANAEAIRILRERGFKVGDVVMADLVMPRNLAFNNLAHQLGNLIAENIEAFDGMKAHDVLKRIQVEASIECDETVTDVPGLGRMVFRKPRSLSFASLDQGEFYGFVRQVCDYVSKTYWPGVSPERIARMADCMVD
jgi:hypothetical protein